MKLAISARKLKYINIHCMEIKNEAAGVSSETEVH